MAETLAGRRRDAVAAYVRSRPEPVTRVQICEACGISPRYAYDALRELTGAGVLLAVRAGNAMRYSPASWTGARLAAATRALKQAERQAKAAAYRATVDRTRHAELIADRWKDDVEALRDVISYLKTRRQRAAAG